MQVAGLTCAASGFGQRRAQAVEIRELIPVSGAAKLLKASAGWRGGTRHRKGEEGVGHED